MSLLSVDTNTVCDTATTPAAYSVSNSNGTCILDGTSIDEMKTALSPEVIKEVTDALSASPLFAQGLDYQYNQQMTSFSKGGQLGNGGNNNATVAQSALAPSWGNILNNIQSLKVILEAHDISDAVLQCRRRANELLLGQQQVIIDRCREVVSKRKEWISRVERWKPSPMAAIRPSQLVPPGGEMDCSPLVKEIENMIGHEREKESKRRREEEENARKERRGRRDVSGRERRSSCVGDKLHISRTRTSSRRDLRGVTRSLSPRRREKGRDEYEDRHRREDSRDGERRRNKSRHHHRRSSREHHSNRSSRSLSRKRGDGDDSERDIRGRRCRSGRRERSRSHSNHSRDRINRSCSRSPTSERKKSQKAPATTCLEEFHGELRQWMANDVDLCTWDIDIKCLSVDNEKMTDESDKGNEQANRSYTLKFCLPIAQSLISCFGEEHFVEEEPPYENIRVMEQNERRRAQLAYMSNNTAANHFYFSSGSYLTSVGRNSNNETSNRGRESHDDDVRGRDKGNVKGIPEKESTTNVTLLCVLSHLLKPSDAHLVRQKRQQFARKYGLSVAYETLPSSVTDATGGCDETHMIEQLRQTLETLQLFMSGKLNEPLMSISSNRGEVQNESDNMSGESSRNSVLSAEAKECAATILATQLALYRLTQAQEARFATPKNQHQLAPLVLRWWENIGVTNADINSISTAKYQPFLPDLLRRLGKRRHPLEGCISESQGCMIYIPGSGHTVSKGIPMFFPSFTLSDGDDFALGSIYASQYLEASTANGAGATPPSLFPRASILSEIPSIPRHTSLIDLHSMDQVQWVMSWRYGETVREDIEEELYVLKMAKRDFDAKWEKERKKVMSAFEDWWNEVEDIMRRERRRGETIAYRSRLRDRSRSNDRHRSGRHRRSSSPMKRDHDSDLYTDKGRNRHRKEDIRRCSQRGHSPSISRNYEHIDDDIGKHPSSTVTMGKKRQRSNKDRCKSKNQEDHCDHNGSHISKTTDTDMSHQRRESEKGTPQTRNVEGSEGKSKSNNVKGNTQPMEATLVVTTSPNEQVANGMDVQDSRTPNENVKLLTTSTHKAHEDISSRKRNITSDDTRNREESLMEMKEKYRVCRREAKVVLDRHLVAVLEAGMFARRARIAFTLPKPIFGYLEEFGFLDEGNTNSCSGGGAVATDNGGQSAVDGYLTEKKQTNCHGNSTRDVIMIGTSSSILGTLSMDEVKAKI